MSETEMIALWAGWVLSPSHRRATRPDGRVLDGSRFRSTFGGRQFIFTTFPECVFTNAWHAFLHLRKVQGRGHLPLTPP